jgi:hypothetical protein
MYTRAGRLRNGQENVIQQEQALPNGLVMTVMTQLWQ